MTTLMVSEIEVHKKESNNPKQKLKKITDEIKELVSTLENVYLDIEDIKKHEWSEDYIFYKRSIFLQNESNLSWRELNDKISEIYPTSYNLIVSKNPIKDLKEMGVSIISKEAT